MLLDYYAAKQYATRHPLALLGGIIACVDSKCVLQRLIEFMLEEGVPVGACKSLSTTVDISVEVEEPLSMLRFQVFHQR